MSIVFPIFIVVVVLAVVAAIAYAYVKERKRTEELKQVADILGFDFYPQGDAAFFQSLDRFHLFDQCTKRWNLMRGKAHNLEGAIFDREPRLNGVCPVRWISQVPEASMTAVQDEGPSMYVPRMDAILSRWFTTYDDARASLESEGGYLFPYRGYFFVTTSEAIRELGLDPADPDWVRIGCDWVRPTDPAAWERLKEKRMLAL